MKEFVEKLIGRLENRIKYNELCHKEFPNAKMSLTYEVQINAYKNAIEIVNQLAEEYNNGWIPCEKELPKENEFVIASVHPNERVNGGNPVIITRYDSVSASYWHNGIIQAWMPLPAPYQKGE